MTMAAADTIKGIQHVVVDKEKLIARLKANREQHQKDYNEALVGYREALVVLLTKMLDLAKAGEKVEHYIHLEVPEDHTKDYDRVIGMLDMSIETHVLITSGEYSQYVMDEWNWKDRFATTSAAYKNNR